MCHRFWNLNVANESHMCEDLKQCQFRHKSIIVLTDSSESIFVDVDYNPSSCQSNPYG